MKRFCSLSATLSASALLFLGGCAVISGTKSEKHRMEMSIHKTRTDIDEVKHDLNTYEIEHHVLEGKLINQEQAITTLREQVTTLRKELSDSLGGRFRQLETTVKRLAEKQEKMVSDLRRLGAHANDTTTALSQYKEKIAYFEKMIGAQKEQIKHLLALTERKQTANSYTVRAGDSLEKIAKDKGTTVEAIKEKNGLSDDLIVVGQAIALP
ncbi:MAG: LysM peptidoglycan-binding domain-containing protein [Simkaniaceae bacterium]|nr:LysM peptidoglycan-binding domain-containing protein [Simkaniaceae bacterium]